MGSIIDELKKAKAASDAKRYGEKEGIMRGLLTTYPDQFYVDSSEKDLVGITHEPSGFRMHLRHNAVPTVFWDKRPLPKMAEYERRAIETIRAIAEAVDVDAALPKIAQLYEAAYDHRITAIDQAAVEKTAANWLEWEEVPIAAVLGFVKAAADPAQVPPPMKLGDVMKYPQMAYQAPQKLLGGPNALSASLVGGLLGAAGGYGLGWLGEQLLPDEYFEPGKLRRTGAIAGGLGLAAPGLMAGLGGGDWLTPFDKMEMPPEVKKAATFIDRALTEGLGPCESVMDNCGVAEKIAEDEAGLFAPTIPVDAFNNVVWAGVSPPNPFGTRNPYDGSGDLTATPPQIAAAASGLVSGASALRGGAEFISPYDISRVAMGAGAGWLSGALVGQTLGALAGLRPEQQKKLQEAGLWGGLLTQVVPLAFGGK